MSFVQGLFSRLLHACGFFLFICISGNCWPQLWMWTLQKLCFDFVAEIVFLKPWFCYRKHRIIDRHNDAETVSLTG